MCLKISNEYRKELPSGEVCVNYGYHDKLLNELRKDEFGYINLYKIYSVYPKKIIKGPILKYHNFLLESPFQQSLYKVGPYYNDIRAERERALEKDEESLKREPESRAQ